MTQRLSLMKIDIHTQILNTKTLICLFNGTLNFEIDNFDLKNNINEHLTCSVIKIKSVIEYLHSLKWHRKVSVFKISLLI